MSGADTLDGAALEQLAREAAADAAQPAQGGEPAAQSPATDPVEEWDEAIKFAVSLIGAAYPSIEPIYTDEVRRRLAGSVHAVAAKYNFTVSALFARYAAEIQLAMVAFPIARQTIAAIRADNAAREAKAKPAAAPQPAEEGAPIVAQPAKPGTLRPNA